MERVCTVCDMTKPIDAFHKNGHGGYRIRCKDCINAALKAYRANTKDQMIERRRESGRRWRENHLELARQKSRQYYAQNGEKVRESQAAWRRTDSGRSVHREAARRWRERNPERTAELRREARYKRRRVLATLRCDFTAEQWAEKVRRCGGRCYYCGSKKKLTQDHIIPISKGGEHTWHNIVPACLPCNASKGDRDLVTFLSKRDGFGLMPR